MNKLKTFLIVGFFFLVSYVHALPEGEPIFVAHEGIGGRDLFEVRDGAIDFAGKEVAADKLTPEQRRAIEEGNMPVEAQRTLAEQLANSGVISLVKPSAEGGLINILTQKPVDVLPGMDLATASQQDWNALALQQARAQEKGGSPVTQVIDPLAEPEQIFNEKTGRWEYNPQHEQVEYIYLPDGTGEIYDPSKFASAVKGPFSTSGDVETLQSTLKELSPKDKAYEIFDDNKGAYQSMIAQADILTTIADKFALYQKNSSPELLKNIAEWLNVMNTINPGDATITLIGEMVSNYLENPGNKTLEQFVGEVRTAINNKFKEISNALSQGLEIIEGGISQAQSEQFNADEVQKFEELKEKFEKQQEKITLRTIELDENLVPKSLREKISDFFSGLVGKLKGLFSRSTRQPIPQPMVNDAVNRLNTAQEVMQKTQDFQMPQSFTDKEAQRQVFEVVKGSIEDLNKALIDIYNLREEFEQASLIVSGDDVSNEFDKILGAIKQQKKELWESFVSTFNVDLFETNLKVNEKPLTVTELHSAIEELYQKIQTNTHDGFDDILTMEKYYKSLNEVVAEMRSFGCPDEKVQTLITTIETVKQALDGAKEQYSNDVNAKLKDAEQQGGQPEKLVLSLVYDQLSKIPTDSVFYNRDVMNDVLQRAGLNPADSMSKQSVIEDLKSRVENFEKSQEFAESIRGTVEAFNKAYQAVLADYIKVQLATDSRQNQAEALLTTLSSLNRYSVDSKKVAIALTIVPEFGSTSIYYEQMKGIRDVLQTGSTMEKQIVDLKGKVQQLMQ